MEILTTNMTRTLIGVLFTSFFILTADSSFGVKEITREQRTIDENVTLAGRYDQPLLPDDHNYQANYKANTEKTVFFVWDYKDHGETISKLLSGEEVTFYADVKKSDPRYDAFRLIEVQFSVKTSDEKTQPAVNNVIFNFELESDHLGNSYFRLNDEYYKLQTPKYEIWYSLENDEEKGPVSRSFAYDAIRRYMFSPYASWTLKLYPSVDKSPEFPVLQQYKDKIRIELTGHGSKLEEKLFKKYCKRIESNDLPKV